MSQQSGAAGYASLAGDVVSEDFDGEFVVLDLSSGKYYSMDAAASALWRAITTAYGSGLGGRLDGAPRQALA